MRMYDIIQKKRDKNALSKEEIDFFISGYTRGEIPDYQASALLMAIYFNGMTHDETVNLTMAMRDSGDKADLSVFGGKAVDKHSTGGVGDKTTLIVAPIVASLGCCTAKMSGRGLGHTGGTIDKLESISGYNTSLCADAFINQVKECSVAVVGQTGNFAPADKKLYALRDVTATVDSIPLIASSIMSKKLAAGADTIVLDVKVGSGAFMKTADDAQSLAKLMVEIAKSCGKKSAALITDMDVPLGKNIGNALEVEEAVEVLKGSRECDDLREVCVALATEMVSLVSGISSQKARVQVEKVLCDGTALEVFRQWINAQGGNTDFIDSPKILCPPKNCFEIKANTDGCILGMNAEAIGKASCMLGAGRNKKEDKIDYSAGISLEKKTGDWVSKGDTLATLYSSTVNDFSVAEDMFLSALSFSEKQPEKKPLIYKIIT